LVFGATGADLIKSYVSEDIEIYQHHDTAINMRVLLHTIIRFRLNREGYLRSYLAFVKPRVVITNEDNDLLFYRIPDLVPDCTTIAIQNGRRDNFARHQHGGFFELLRHLRETRPVSVSVLCTFGTAVAQLYRDALGTGGIGSLIPIGSLRNNAVAPRTTSGLQRLVYVSSMPNFELGMNPLATDTFAFYHGRPVSPREYWGIESSIVREAATFAANTNRKFVILGKRASRHPGEYRHYKEILQEQEWEFVPANTQSTSYEAIFDDDVVVSPDSTLAYEIFGRGIRAAFIGARLAIPGLTQHRDCDFGFPLSLPRKGPFWTNEISTAEIHRVLSFSADSTSAEWVIASENHRKQLMLFDPGNGIFCEILKSLNIASTGPHLWPQHLVPLN